METPIPLSERARALLLAKVQAINTADPAQLNDTQALTNLIKPLEPNHNKKEVAQKPKRTYTYKAPRAPKPTVSSTITEPPRARKAKVKPVFDPVPQETILNLGLSIPDLEVRALYFTLYLTAARIGEALRLRQSDISGSDNCVYFDLITEKTMLRTADGAIQYGRRVVPVALYSTKRQVDLIEKEMFGQVQNWTNQLKPDSPLFRYPPDRRTNVNYQFRNLITQTTSNTSGNLRVDCRVHPHILRHWRLSHLSRIYNFNDSQLREITGWRTNKLASVYVQTTTQDLADKMANV